MIKTIVSRVVAGLAITAILALASNTQSANAATAAIPNPNPNGQTFVTLGQLPTCAGVIGSKGDDMAGQGWTGDWQLPVQIGSRTAWAVLMLPCWSPPYSASNSLNIVTMSKTISASGTFTVEPVGAEIKSIRVRCNNTTTTLSGLPATTSAGISNAPFNWGLLIAKPTVSNLVCQRSTDTLERIDVVWSTTFNGTLITGVAQWRATLWTDGERKAQPTNVGNVPFPGGAQETPIVCNYTIDTTDILTTTASFFTSFGPWVGCLFTPADWDRSNQVATAYETSGISRTGDILTAVLPTAGNVVCGDVLDSNLGFIDLYLSTCGVSNAVPTWIKIAITTVVAIALLLLFIRRVQWTVIK